MIDEWKMYHLRPDMKSEKHELRIEGKRKHRTIMKREKTVNWKRIIDNSAGQKRRWLVSCYLYDIYECGP